MANALTDMLGEIKKETQQIVTTVNDGFGERSSLTDTEWHPAIPPKEINLRGYQRAAAETIIKYKRGILGFAPGLGKTVIALTAIANSGTKTVCVVPPSLVMVWEMEAARCFPNLEVVTTRGGKSQIIPDGDILVIGDSIVAKRVKDIEQWNPSGIVIDEAQRHKNPKAKRARAVEELADGIRKKDGLVILLTGTLAVNNAVEVWMPSKIAGIAKAVTGSNDYKKWIHRWCYVDQMAVEKKLPHNKTKTIWIEVPKGASDPEGLNKALCETGYIRVEREDVVDMPEKVYAYRSVPGNNESMREYKRILNDFEGWLADSGGEEAVKNARGAEVLVQLGKLVEKAGLAKLESTAEYVSSLVEEGEQVVVMAHHKSVVKGLKEALTALKVKSVTFFGESSAEEKQDAYNNFKAGNVPVFIGNISSAGTGLNLENSAQIVFAQLPWSAGEFVQASDRIYRVTQKRECTIHVLSVPGTIDERMASVLEDKMKIIDAINAGVGEADDGDSIADEVLGMM